MDPGIPSVLLYIWIKFICSALSIVCIYLSMSVISFSLSRTHYCSQKRVSCCVDNINRGAYRRLQRQRQLSERWMPCPTLPSPPLSCTYIYLYVCVYIEYIIIIIIIGYALNGQLLLLLLSVDEFVRIIIHYFVSSHHILALPLA